MTEKQFADLKVGDMVMNNALTKQVEVLDINRKREMINTGGAWRLRKNVRLPGPPPPDHFTKLEPATHFNISVKMLKRFTTLECIILHTIMRAGPDGFVGTNETLCEATQLCRSFSTFTVLISRLVREGFVVRDCLARKVTRFTLNETEFQNYR